MPANPANFEERLVVVADAMAALIAADPYFAAAGPVAAVPVVTERKGDINAMISAALNKLGLCVTVVAADSDSLTRQGNTLQVRVRLVAQISELYLINQGITGSKKPALAAAARVMKAIDQKPNGLDPANERHRSGFHEFKLPDEQPFRLVPDAKYITYHVTAYTTVAF